MINDITSDKQIDEIEPRVENIIEDANSDIMNQALDNSQEDAEQNLDASLINIQNKLNTLFNNTQEDIDTNGLKLDFSYDNIVEDGQSDRRLTIKVSRNILDDIGVEEEKSENEHSATINVKELQADIYQ